LHTVVVGNKKTIINSYKDLQNLEIATPTGVKYQKKLDQDVKLNITRVKDYENAIKMLQDDRVDAIIAPEKILLYHLKKFT